MLEVNFRPSSLSKALHHFLLLLSSAAPGEVSEVRNGMDELLMRDNPQAGVCALVSELSVRSQLKYSSWANLDPLWAHNWLKYQLPQLDWEL